MLILPFLESLAISLLAFMLRWAQASTARTNAQWRDLMHRC